MYRIPIELQYQSKDGEIKTRRFVPFPDGSKSFSTGKTCMTGFDANADNGKGGIRRFENSHILKMRSCSFPVKIPKDHQKYFEEK